MLGDDNVSEPRGSAPISLIGIHTSQGKGTARNLADYCLTHEVSYHTIVSPGVTLPFVSEHRAAWSMRRANPFSLNLCFVGYAEWTDADWILHNHGMLYDAALVVRGWSKHYNIPLVRLTPGEIIAGRRGLIAHDDWTKAEKIRNPLAKDSHWDPGPGFPWPAFIDLCKEESEMRLTDRIVSKLDGGSNRITIADLFGYWDKWIVESWRKTERLDEIERKVDDLHAKVDELIAQVKA